jgi:hypothetical protein
MSKATDGLIVFSSGHWETSWTPRYISIELAKFYPVIYLGSIGLRGMAVPKRKDLWPVSQRLRTLLKRQLTHEQGVWVLRPKAVVGVEPTRLSRLGTSIIRWQLFRTMTQLSLSHPKVILGLPNAFGIAQTITSPMNMVYYPVDDYAAFGWIERSQILTLERAIVDHGIRVITPSPELGNRYAHWGAEVNIIEQGVHWDHFSKALGDHIETPDVPWLQSLEWPGSIVALTGTLDDRIDIKYLLELAQILPSVLFLMVGPVASPRVGELQSVPNIRFTGPVAFDHLPYVLSRCSACLVPYVRNDLTTAMQPIKLREYLAAGRLVVGTELPALMGFSSDDVRTTNLPGVAAEFLRSASNEGPESKLRRSDSMRSHTWAARAREVANCLAN